MAAAKNPFRHVDLKVGAFLAVTIVLVGVGLFLLSRAHNWFVETLLLEATLFDLPPDSTLGLSPGADVQIFGNTAGTVTEVSFKADETKPDSISYQLHIRMQVRGEFIALVRSDSEAVIKKTLSLGGSTFVQIIAGSGTPLTNDDPTDVPRLPCRIAPDMTALVQEILQGFREEDGHLQGALRNTRTVMRNIIAITERLLEGEGVFGRLIKDEQTTSRFDRALVNMGDSLDKVAQVLDSVGQRLTQTQDILQEVQGLVAGAHRDIRDELPNVRRFIAQMQRTTEQVNATLNEIKAITKALRRQTDKVPGLLLQTQELLRQTTKTLEGIQQTWLLRDYIEPDELNRLSPADLTDP
ncbi:MAG: MlaD family protein [Candidatus Competibacteraceae bacterium]